MTYPHGDTDTQEMDEANVLISDNLDLIYRTKGFTCVPQIVLIRRVLQSTDEDVTCRMTMSNGSEDIAMHMRGLAPLDSKL